METVKGRIVGFDVARAFAILGMMLVNYKIVFAQGIVKFENVNNFIGLFEGRAAAVFLILAGIGLRIMTKKGYDSGDKIIRDMERRTILKRAGFLMILGTILYVVFGWSADILHYYGVYMILVCLFLYLDKWTVLASAMGITVFSALLQIFMDYQLGWNATFTDYLDMNTLNGLLRNTFFNGYHPVFPWFAFILIGLVIGQLDFRDKQVVKGVIVSGLSFAVLTEGLSHYLIEWSSNAELMIYFFDTKPMNPTLFYIFAATGWAMAFIGVCVLGFKANSNSKLTKSLILTGQMALTHYVVHVIDVLVLFQIIDGLKYRDESFVLILSFVVFALMTVFSSYWAKQYKRGPLEWVMRKVA